MPVNLALGHVSNDFLIAAIVIYSLSVVAFAGDFAFGRPRRADATARVRQARERATALAVVGAASVAGMAKARRTARWSAGTRRFLPLRTRCPSYRSRRCARSARQVPGSGRP